MIDSLLSNTISRSKLAEDWAGMPQVFVCNPIATIVFDEATWRISAANPSACRLYGYLLSELNGMSLLDLVWKPVQEQFGPTEFEMKAMFLNRPEPWAHVRKDGQEILVETIAHEMNGKGRSALVLFVSDKTEAMRAQQQLLDALNKVEAALKAKTDFLSTISHEIRTPMNGVIGMTAMLADTELNHEQRDFVNTIGASGELLLSIIDDILDFTKAEQNKLILEMLDFDLPEFIEDVVEVIGVSARQKGLRIKTAIAEDVPANLIGDSGRLKQIIINLLTNAVKFTERGTIHISIRLAEESKPPKLHFEVRDTGIGISTEGKARLFQGLGQVDSSITRKFGGTGLGLAISKRLVTMMGGEIGVHSEPGQGSNFWFTARFLPGSKLARARHSAEHLKGKKVLVLQKNVEERAATRILLEEMGMYVTEAGNAPEALSLCSATVNGRARFSFCVVDSNLPVIDGMEFARMLRRQPFGANIGIVLIVAHHTPEQSLEGQQIGISTFVVKPLRKKQLTIAFSRPAPEQIPSEAKAPTAQKPAPQGHYGGPPSILLVEDNVVNQKVASNSLLKLGYAVEVAANGLQAIDAFERRQFDLILMDCHMPLMDGYTATQKIRACGVSGRYVPIIAMTADVVETQRERCIAAGMNDFLSKPVRRDVLSDMLEHWLAQA